MGGDQLRVSSVSYAPSRQLGGDGINSVLISLFIIPRLSNELSEWQIQLEKAEYNVQGRVLLLVAFHVLRDRNARDAVGHLTAIR